MSAMPSDVFSVVEIVVASFFQFTPTVFTRFITMSVIKNSPFLHTTLVCSLALALPAFGQQTPDAGQTLRQLQTNPKAPAPNGGAVLDIPRPMSALTQVGGPKIEVTRFTFEGNKNIDASELKQLLAENLTTNGSSGPDVSLVPQQLDMSELARLALEVEFYYQAAGYPFARVHVPPQQVVSGEVRMHVVEGTYDEVKAVSQVPEWQAVSQKWLAKIAPGQVIRKADLERTALLLSDLPGVSAVLTASPGSATGTAAVDVELQRKNRHDGEIGLANHGSRYSGEWHARLQANINSPFVMGDQLVATALHSNHKMWQAGLNYSAPVGFDGWRVQVGYSDTRYDLTKGFEGNSGNAKVSSAGLIYPVLRSSASNARISATLQQKKLFNSRSEGASTETYSVNSLPLVLNFDRRDEWGGGGVTYGMVGLTYGDLKKVDAIRQGSFRKLNADVSRIQNMTSQVSLYGRFASQWANKNLDSAEGMGLGGAAGVRAYPSGEAYGDEGWLAQFEIRYAMGAYAPYVFYDHGQVKVNAEPALINLPSPDQARAGAGLGLRYERQQWKLDTAISWRTKGGAPTATQGNDPKPRAWIALSYKY